MEKPLKYIVEAGIDVLWVIANIDSEFHQMEVEVLEWFLKKFESDEKPTRLVMEEEIGFLESLPEEKLRKRFDAAVEYIEKKASVESRQKIFEFAYYIIIADEKVLESERELFKILFVKWGLDGEKVKGFLI